MNSPSQRYSLHGHCILDILDLLEIYKDKRDTTPKSDLKKFLTAIDMKFDTLKSDVLDSGFDQDTKIQIFEQINIAKESLEEEGECLDLTR